MEVLNIITFYLTAAVIFFALAVVIISKETINAVISSIVVFLGFAVLYFMQNAPLNAAIQIAIYGVSVSLMVMFAFILTDLKKEKEHKLKFRISKIMGCLFILLFSISSYFLVKDDFQTFLSELDYSEKTFQTTILNTASIMGEGIFNNYLLGFELCSILLLAVLIGVCIIFIREKGDKT